MTAERLLREAERVRRLAYAPYSRFTVGAALLAADGQVFLGANVENASYGLSVCAERVALWNAVSRGVREFTALAVAGPRGTASPCGACRQTLAEFAPRLRVHWRSATGRVVTRRLSRLLPEPFRLTAPRR